MTISKTSRVCALRHSWADERAKEARISHLTRLRTQERPKNTADAVLRPGKEPFKHAVQMLGSHLEKQSAERIHLLLETVANETVNAGRSLIG